MTHITLYTKPGCCLCEEAEEVIESVRARRVLELVKRNILDDPSDYDRYKHDIPVILVDGREIARHRVTEKQIEAALEVIKSVAVIVMAKAPRAGRVKTRLQPPLSAGEAARVQREFSCHLVWRICEMEWGQVIVCHDPPDAAEELRKMLGRDRVEYVPQVEGDLGARLAAAAKPHRRRATHVLFLGVDAPDVPESHLRHAAQLLAEHEIVIGPAEDGGFWTVALRAGVDATSLFAGIEWSSGREQEQTVARARTLGYNVGLAGRWHDVDRPADLERLVERLRRSTDPRDQELLFRLRFLPPDGESQR